MKMAYEYVRITQIHSLARFPSRWCYPLSLALHYREKELGVNDYVIEPKFCRKFYESPDGDSCCYQELIRGSEYITQVPVSKKLNKKKEERYFEE